MKAYYAHIVGPGKDGKWDDDGAAYIVTEPRDEFSSCVFWGVNIKSDRSPLFLINTVLSDCAIGEVIEKRDVGKYTGIYSLVHSCQISYCKVSKVFFAEDNYFKRTPKEEESE